MTGTAGGARLGAAAAVPIDSREARTMLGSATRLATLLLVTSAASAAAQVRELVFTPVPPCRLLDTRPPNDPLVPGQARSFAFRGRCRIPGLTNDGGVESNRAAAVSLNIVAVGAPGPGHLVAWPANQSMPQASIINYSSTLETGGLNIANGVIVPLCDQVAVNPCASGDVSFMAAVSSVHLVVDVTGYFASRGISSANRYGAGGVDSFLCLNTTTGTRYGLSRTIAHFADAAQACPPGTWLCSDSEMSASGCDTARDDTACDVINCAGQCVDLPADEHRGWVRQVFAPLTRALFVDEAGFDPLNRLSTPVCEYLPTWCCSRE